MNLERLGRDGCTFLPLSVCLKVDRVGSFQKSGMPSMLQGLVAFVFLQPTAKEGS